MIKNLLLIALFVACGFSCKTKDKSQTESTENAATGEPASAVKATITDSLPLYNEESAYGYVNLSRVDSGIITAFQHPNLNLDIISKTGAFIRQVGKKGSLPENFHGDYLETRYSANKRIYVMDEGAAVWLKVYDNNFKYLKTIDLYRDLINYTVPPVSGGFIPISLNDSTDRIVITPLSTSEDPSEKSYYNNPVLIQFDLNINNYTVRNVKKILSLKDISSIAESINTGKKKWEDAVPLIQYAENTFYIKFPFDQDVYTYDTSWNLIKKTTLSPVHKGFNVTTDLKHVAGDMNESFRTQMQFQFSNISFNAMTISGDRLFLLYTKPVAKDKVPDSPPAWQKYLPVPVLHVLDLKSGKEYSTDLPEYIYTYYISPVSSSEVYVTQHPFSAEDIHAYKIKVSF